MKKNRLYYENIFSNAKIDVIDIDRGLTFQSLSLTDAYLFLRVNQSGNFELRSREVSCA